MSAFTDSELAYLRADPGLGRLATIGADGLPHVVPLGWSYNQQLDTIDVGGRDLERTQKFRNVEAEPRVALVIDDVLPPWRPRAVLIRGYATTVDDGGTVLIRITPHHVTSWGPMNAEDNVPARPSMAGVHHFTLTVPDPSKSAEWYCDVLGFEILAAIPHPVFDRLALRHAQLPTLLTLIAHPTTGTTRFDEAHVGLDHVAFAVGSSEEVAEWAAWLDAKGVPHSEIKDGALPGSQLITFRDPDGIQIECYFS